MSRVSFELQPDVLGVGLAHDLYKIQKESKAGLTFCGKEGGDEGLIGSWLWLWAVGLKFQMFSTAVLCYAWVNHAQMCVWERSAMGTPLFRYNCTTCVFLFKNVVQRYCLCVF